MKRSKESVGRSFAPKVDVEMNTSLNRYSASVSIGEDYYETDAYPRPEYALAEAKGYLDGIKSNIEKELENINEQIK